MKFRAGERVRSISKFRYHEVGTVLSSYEPSAQGERIDVRFNDGETERGLDTNLFERVAATAIESLDSTFTFEGRRTTLRQELQTRGHHVFVLLKRIDEEGSLVCRSVAIEKSNPMDSEEIPVSEDIFDILVNHGISVHELTRTRNPI